MMWRARPRNVKARACSPAAIAATARAYSQSIMSIAEGMGPSMRETSQRVRIMRWGSGLSTRPLVEGIGKTKPSLVSGL
jgi:hypothetical protein